MPKESSSLPSLNAALLLADGKIFWGKGIGKPGTILGEICFNTAMTGYQEILTDPSYNGQVVTFTFPHIGNVGTNSEDIESKETPHLGASGLVIREPITTPSNFRATKHLNDWLIAHGITGISGVDTRALTRAIRKNGAANVAIVVSDQLSVTSEQLEEAKEKLAKAPNMKGLELAAKVSTKEAYEWTEPKWSLGMGGTLPPSALRAASPAGSSQNVPPRTLASSLPLATHHYHIVAVDYGIKLNILRCLVSSGCRVTIVPATASAEEILEHKPNGVFLSNGPGDPAATGKYALPIIKKLIESGLPIFGICLGHQLLGIAMGDKTEKMKQGHRGANHPVKDLTNGKVEITSQNHGFAVSDKDLPADVEVTHRSLFDGTVQGLRHKTKPIFSVQGHPEASPGPHDSMYLFEQFTGMMRGKKN